MVHRYVKAVVVPGLFLLQEQEEFDNPHRQHCDVRSPLIYSDPSRSGCSAIFISVTADEEKIQQTLPVMSQSCSVNISMLLLRSCQRF